MGLQRKAVLRAAPARMGWARLLRRVFDLDVERPKGIRHEIHD